MKVITAGGGFIGYRLAYGLLIPGTLAEALGKQPATVQIIPLDTAFFVHANARL